MLSLVTEARNFHRYNRKLSQLYYFLTAGIRKFGIVSTLEVGVPQNQSERNYEDQSKQLINRE